PHPLLAQLPLTVSPFLSLPTPTPLPYTYKQLPSTLPPSILNPLNSQNPTSSDPSQPPPGPPAYIHSSNSQTSSTPDQILTSCHALQQHLQDLETSARRTVAEWEERRRQADLVEKRRVAPGWLDGDVKLLVPENVEPDQWKKNSGKKDDGLVEKRDGIPDPREGEELDRVFGGLDIRHS
ncbi:hypothetical protein GQ43DRAFT_410867, partial [Delitschia confertaspora ATCC 74209]